MVSKINLGRIVFDHVKTLKDNRNGGYNLGDILLQFLVPGIVAFFVRDVDLDNSKLGIIITSLSVFAGLLFNLLVLIYSARDRIQDDVHPDLLPETYTNVSFGILICIIAIFAGMVHSLGISIPTDLGKISEFALVRTIISFPLLPFIVFFCLGMFCYTLLMILKRVYRLL